MNKLSYEIWQPNFFKPHAEMNKKEAKAYFDDYISQIPERIAYLENYLKDQGQNQIALDYSLASLVTFWDWYGDLLTKEQKENYTEGTPLNIPFEILGIGADFAMYFGELFIKHHPNIEWGFITKPKSNFLLHRPQLIGFQRDLHYCPEHSISICVRRALQEKNPNEVKRMFDVWSEWA